MSGGVAGICGLRGRFCIIVTFPVHVLLINGGEVETVDHLYCKCDFFVVAA